MKRALLVGATVAALLLSSAAVATAAERPSCGAALSALADAKVAAGAPVAALKALTDTQVILDKAVVDAKAKLAANVDPALVAPLTVAVTVAEQAAAAGKAKVNEAIVKHDAAVKVVADAQLVVTEACTGPSATVTTTPAKPAPAPVIYQQVPVYPSVAPATGGGPA